MKFKEDSKVFDGAFASMNLFGTILPLEFGGARKETLACRDTAWFGTTLCCSPVYEVTGPDAPAFLASISTNKANFAEMAPGTSKHMLMCNERGYMIADGVCMCREAGVYRTYWLAPVLTYILEGAKAQGTDVTGTWITDEYFFQVDGPKSLEIMEDATKTNLHDLKFARNKQVQVAGTPMTIHRLGMSGCLAYEMHGAEEDAEAAYTAILASVEKFGGVKQGFRNYVVLNHTPAGYPNQFQHFAYDLYSGDPAFAGFAKQNCAPQIVYGSAEAEPGIMNVTPFDIGWGGCVNLDHDFVGKDALIAAKDSHRQAVTLEWDADDVADVFRSQFQGRGEEPYEPIEAYHDAYNGAAAPGIYGCLVQADGKTIGHAAGRCYDFYDQRMLSLAFIDPAYAVEGRELSVIWGKPNSRQKTIRAKVAPYPYFDGEWRNETCDVDKMVPPFKG